MKTGLIWNWSLKFYFQQFVSLFNSGAINLYDINFETTVKKISTIFSCIILPICMISIAVIFYALHKKIKEKNFIKHFGELMVDLKYNSQKFLIINWRPI